MSILIKNIRCLVHTEDKPRLKYSGYEMSALLTIENAFLFIVNDLIHSFGKMNELTLSHIHTKHPDVLEIDATGKLVYKGAMEDNPSDPGASTQMFLKNAINNMLAGTAPDPSNTKSIGCTIKRL